jgi:hypothetical protein
MKLIVSASVFTIFSLISVQTATAQVPNPHPAHEALKGLQPFIGNWAGEFEAEGGFEGLAKGRMVTGTNHLRWILNKTAIQLTWDNTFGIITLDPLSKKLNWHSFGYDGKVYWSGKGVGEVKDKVLYFKIEENTINKTNTKYELERRKSNGKTMIVSYLNLVKDGKRIGSLKDNKMTREPFKKKAAVN